MFNISQKGVAKKARKPILMMARTIKDELKEKLADAIVRHLYWGYATEHYGEKVLPSSRFVDALVTLARPEREVTGVRAIVNYNFDDLLDKKLSEQKVRCMTVVSGEQRVPTGTLPCYHVHGVLGYRGWKWFGSAKAAQEQTKHLVFSEDEYHVEYSDPYRWSNMTQMNFLGTSCGLFVGLSLEDPNMRRLIDVTHAQYPEIKNYAILTRDRSLKRSSDSETGVLRNLFEDVESRSLEKIGVDAIWADTYAEVPDLVRAICFFDGQTRRHNPIRGRAGASRGN